MSFLKKEYSALFFVSCFFIFDRIAKQLSIKGVRFNVSFIDFSFFKNDKISFGIPFVGIFFYFTLIFILLFVVFNIINAHKRKNIIEFSCFTLILTGALSNLLDRIKYGAVIDYLNINNLIIFNFADIIIFFGVLILIKKVLMNKVCLI